MEGDRPWFWPKKFNRGEGRLLPKMEKKVMVLGFRFFLYFLLMLSKLPPPFLAENEGYL